MDILTLRINGDHDYSSLQMISGKRLAQLHRIEALAKELVRELAQPASDTQADTPVLPQQG